MPFNNYFNITNIGITTGIVTITGLFLSLYLELRKQKNECKLLLENNKNLNSEIKLYQSVKNITEIHRYQVAKNRKNSNHNTNNNNNNNQNREDDEEKPVNRICLTGGPCGGKSTSLVQIKQNMEQLGFDVLLVPEAATLLMTGGVSPSNNKLAFQIQVAKVQMALEDAFYLMAKQSSRPTIVVCDRGVMDGKAYLDDQGFELVLDELKESVVSMRDRRYDAVLHLTTAAKGTAFYSTENNQTRLETVEEAIEIDKKTMQAWLGATNHFVIDNSTDFTAKVRRVVDRICSIVNVPTTKARTRKFLLSSSVDIQATQKFLKESNLAIAEFSLEVIYLTTIEPNVSLRVRKRGQFGSYFYTHQAIFTKADEKTGYYIITSVIERQISAREYVNFMKQADPDYAPVSKNLITLQWNGSLYELHIVLNYPINIVEIKCETYEEKINFPPFFRIEKEVTNDFKYDTMSFALRKK